MGTKKKNNELVTRLATGIGVSGKSLFNSHPPQQ
jgi:hypothetical protein